VEQILKKFGFLKRYKFNKTIKKCNDELTVLIRNDPSTDSLASFYAFKMICEFYHINIKGYYTGTIQHKGLFNIMESDIEHLPDVITTEFSGPLALIDVVPSDLPEGLATLIGLPVIIISHSKAAIKNIKCDYKDVRADVETTSTIMIQYLKSLKIPIDKTTGTLLLYAIRDRTRIFLTNINHNGLEAYLFVLGQIDHDLLLKLENPGVKSETFNDLAKAISNRIIKDVYLIANTGYVKDPNTLSKVCKYMLDLEGISTALIFAVDISNIYAYAITDDIEINLKQIFKKAFGQCGNIIGTPSYASITMPLGLFNVITKDQENSRSRELMLNTISDSISSRFLKVIEEGEGKLDSEQ
jgi:nanoRNase/pAp phosphatase (c-di-AMP/oligoRNAs hydrolase)